MRVHTSTKNELQVSHSNTLKGVHIQIGPRGECPQTGTRFYTLVLVLPTTRSRFVYFKSKSVQLEWFQNLLKAQGFRNQQDQYDFTPRPLQRSKVCNVMHARHKSSGLDVVVKVADKS